MTRSGNIYCVLRRWKEKLECKEFWRWADIEVTDDNLDDVTKSNRILLVDTISLDKSLSDLSANIFLNFLINCDETLSARSLSLEDTNPSTIDVDTLASAVLRLEETNLNSSGLTMNQVNAIFRKLASSDVRKLEALEIADNVLSSVSPSILSIVVVRLKEVGMSSTELTEDQLEAVLIRIAQTEDLRLKSLDLSFNKLSTVKSSILVSGIIKVKSANLSWTDLTDHQLERLFNKIVETESQDLGLQDLDVFDNDLASVEPGTLAQAILRLERVNLSGLGLTPDQVTTIITGIAHPHSQTDKHPPHLSLQGFDFSLVPQGVLADAVVKLEDVNLSVANNISKYQAAAVIQNMATCDDLCLAVLDISGLDLSLVPPVTLAQAVVRLKRLSCLSEAQITPEQANTLFSKLAETEDLRLETLLLEDNDLSAVSADQIASAIIHLKKVSLTGASLEPAWSPTN